MKRFLLLFFILSYFSGYSQNLDLNILSIPDSLKQNANAVVKLNQTTIDFQSEKDMTITTKRVVYVLNKNGETNIGANTFYDKSNKIKLLEVVIYNQFGKELKRIKRRDFKDQSVADGFSVFTDNRMLYLDYTATEYPYIAEVVRQVETSNTAVISPWKPINNYSLSVLKDVVVINKSASLVLKIKENNFEIHAVRKNVNDKQIVYSVENIPALKYEEFSVGVDKLVPNVKFSLEKFFFEGISGEAKNWEEYGKWYYDNLIAGTESLNDETKSKVLSLIGSEKDPVLIAKKIYKYVQDKSRYVSVQVGLGGWKPMLAKDVDRLGYGDCKALSNYTRSLLKVAGVESYLAIISAGEEKKNIDSSFVYDDTNHMMLVVPYKNENYFLECTSQVAPFNYQGKFTDGRKALLLKPNGGELIETFDFPDDKSQISTTGNYLISEDGTLKGEVVIQTTGTQYDERFFLEEKSREKQYEFYKSYFNHIENLKINKILFDNDKDLIRFQEKISVEAPQYANLVNGKIIFPVNAFNIQKVIPKRYRKRSSPFVIERGGVVCDDLIINLPEGYSVESLPENYNLKTKYGEYTVRFELLSNKKIQYKKILSNYRGYFTKEEYDEFRRFNEQIAKSDNLKIVLLKNI